MESDIFKLFLAESAISSLIHLAWLGRDSDYLPYLMVIPHHTLPTYLRYRPYHKPTKGLCAHLTLPTYLTILYLPYIFHKAALLCSTLYTFVVSLLWIGIIVYYSHHPTAPPSTRACLD